MNIGVEKGSGLPNQGCPADSDPDNNADGYDAIDEIKGADCRGSENYSSGAFIHGPVVVNVAIIIYDEHIYTHQADGDGKRKCELP